MFFFFKQKTAYELRISDWSSDVCSSDLSSTAVSSIASGKIKGLVVMRDERVPVLPDVPSAAETAHPGLHYDIWNMMLVPKGVPAPVVRQLNDAVNRVLASPAVQQRYAQMGEIGRAHAELQSQMRISYAVFGLKKKK